MGNCSLTDSATIQSLIDDIINALNALIYQSVAAAETFLLSAPPPSLGFEVARKEKRNAKSQSIVDTDDQGNIIYPEAEIELSQGIHALETLLEATVDKDFDKFEIYVLRNIFAIEEALLPWVTLPHYKGLMFNTDNAQEKVTVADLKEQREKLEIERIFKSILHKEKAKNDALIGQLRALTQHNSAAPQPPTEGLNMEVDSPAHAPPSSTSVPGPLAFLTPSTTDSRNPPLQPATAKPLTASSSFALAQLPYLKAMLERLRPFLEHKSDGEDDDDDDAGNESPMDDPSTRLRYIENRTRIQIERGQENGAGAGAARGLDDEADAGNWSGRRVAAAELQDLEAFVKSLEDGGTAAGG